MILALDLGTRCGWCVTDGTVYDSGVWDLSGSRFEGGGMRYLRFRRFLQEALGDGTSPSGATLVVYEEVRRHMGVDAAHVYGGLQAVLTEECELRGIPYEAAPVGTIKKYATGKGNASKEMMIVEAAAVYRRRGGKTSRQLLEAARVDAELAEHTARAAKAQASAREIQESIRVLREETARGRNN